MLERLRPSSLNRRFHWTALLIVAVGAAVSGFTLGYGVHEGRHEQHTDFKVFALDVVRRLERVWVRNRRLCLAARLSGASQLI